MQTTQQTTRKTRTQAQNDGIIDVRTFGSLGLHLAPRTTSTPITKVKYDDPVAPASDDATTTDTSTSKVQADDPTVDKMKADEPAPTA